MDVLQKNEEAGNFLLEFGKKYGKSINSIRILRNANF